MENNLSILKLHEMQNFEFLSENAHCTENALKCLELIFQYKTSYQKRITSI